MPIYLHETVDVIPGRMREYLEGMETVFLPIGDDRRLILSGFFQTAGISGRWPEVVAMWTVRDWDDHVWQRKSAGSHPNLSMWQQKGITYRSGGFDRILMPVPFSPLLPTRPDVRAEGGVALQHTITVRPGRARAFVEGFERSVAGRAAEAELTLEILGRSVFRPFEYVAVWSLPDWDAYGRMQRRRDPLDEASNLPGLDALLGDLAGFEEKVLIPARVSPLGGGGDSSVYTG